MGAGLPEDRPLTAVASRGTILHDYDYEQKHEHEFELIGGSIGEIGG